MKRFILILLVMLFTTLNADAVFITYSSTGHPTRMMHPSGRVSSINNFGSNAAFLPRNTAAAAHRLRMHQLQRDYARVRGADRFARPYGYYNHGYGVGPARAVVRSVPPSRFNRNYQITSQSRSYTRNGITYFD